MSGAICYRCSSMSAFEEIRCLDIPLADKLAANSEHLRNNSVEINGIYADIVERLRRAGAGEAAPQLGSPMPGFVLPAHSGRLVSSASLLESGPLVISFNRGHWCSFCRLELLALNDVYSQIKSRGAKLISIMPERAPSVTRLIGDYDIDFPVLIDMDNGYALECALMISLGQTLRDAFTARGTDLGRFQGNDGWCVPIPATFILDQNGLIAGRFVDPDFRNRMSPEAILNCLDTIG
ncbi:MAG: peroxiredoxin [Hyphomicrobiales bacterium]|nr:MAG: peroxiredoxin [Hyphomicrobiales bacterium]